MSSADTGTFKVGSSANISCRSDTPTEEMEWLRDGDVVVAAQPRTHRLDLVFDIVNDSIHDEVYVCRVTRNATDTAEQNFTVSVEGELSIAMNL